MLVRDGGVSRRSGRRGTITMAGKFRSICGALVMAWVMPEFVLMFRLAGTVHETIGRTVLPMANELLREFPFAPRYIRDDVTHPDPAASEI